MKRCRNGKMANGTQKKIVSISKYLFVSSISNKLLINCYRKKSKKNNMTQNIQNLHPENTFREIQLVKSTVMPLITRFLTINIKQSINFLN